MLLPPRSAGEHSWSIFHEDNDDDDFSEKPLPVSLVQLFYEDKLQPRDISVNNFFLKSQVWFDLTDRNWACPTKIRLSESLIGVCDHCG